jgi:GST-like protein
MRSAPEPMPIAIERYRTEALRLTGVLEARLGTHEWLAGRTYSIADIMNFGWLRVADYASVDLAHFPAVKAWVARIAARSAVARALAAVA